MAALCSVPPEILVPATNETLELALGSRVALNCTVRWAGSEPCEPVPAWTKDGRWLGSESSQDTAWLAPNTSERLLASVLQLNLTHDADFGVFACWVSNATATFTLRRVEVAGHVPAVLAALLVLVLLVLLAGLYVRCRLSMLLWYRNRYGDLEVNGEPPEKGTETPSSDFWKELCLALPRKVSFQGTMGDPQTQLQEDKDPMLILHSSYLDSGGDLHPDGDLGTGLRGCVFRSPPPPRIGGLGAPMASAAGVTEDTQLRDGHRPELDVSDLGSRNYGARTDFYCLVTEDDI
ncbi:single Ig IL-1-related receptor [Egretta garzetta]|uniref:single Ig IL-1-related receptor n=1 Tax=Egretta garzetta TaxID=188379 RepID=UPI00051EFCAF|nr:single Ig IL-1-related receptor [Egretta garzetta]